MWKSVVVVVVVVGVAAGNGPIPDEGQAKVPWKRFWKAAGVMGLAMVADNLSSHGKYETSRLLRSRDGRFGGRGWGVSIGIKAVHISVGALVVRKRPKSIYVWEAQYYGMAAGHGVYAVRNLGVKKGEGR